MLNSSIWPTDQTLSGATIPGPSGPGSDGNEGLLHVLQSSRDWASLPDGLISYSWHSLEESYPSAEMLLVYFTASADWVVYRRN